MIILVLNSIYVQSFFFYNETSFYLFAAMNEKKNYLDILIYIYILMLFVEVMMRNYNVTENQVVEATANYLKWAPERKDGGGRKK